VQEHAFQALEQEPHSAGRMRRGGKEFVGDGDELTAASMLNPANFDHSAQVGRGALRTLLRKAMSRARPIGPPDALTSGVPVAFSASTAWLRE